MSQPDTSTLAGKIAVMQAALEGKPIQVRARDSDCYEWFEARPHEQLWQWANCDYRIKPQEPLVQWLSLSDDGVFGCAYSEKPAMLSSGWRAVRMVELTPEIDACLKANGLL